MRIHKSVGCLGLLLALLPSSAFARVTDYTDKLVNVSAPADDDVTEWRDDREKIAVAGNLVHVIWHATSSSDDSRRIMYARSVDGGASFETPIAISSETETAAFMDEENVQLVASGSHVYLAYYEGWPVNLHLRHSVDGGETFDDVILYSGANHNTNIFMEAKDDKLVMLWALDMQDSPKTKALYAEVSTDGGETLEEKVLYNSTSVWRVVPQDVLYAGSGIHVLYTVEDWNNYGSTGHLFGISSQDDGGTFADAQELSVLSADGKMYAPAVHITAYSPSFAACDDALLMTWTNVDEWYDGVLQASVNVRRSTDFGTTWEAPITLHTLTMNSESKSPGQETIVCRGTQAFVADMVSGNYGYGTRVWSSSDSGASWDEGVDVGEGGWWPTLHASEDTLYVVNGALARIEMSTGRLHALTGMIPVSFENWDCPMKVMDENGNVHAVGKTNTISFDEYSPDIVYRKLGPAAEPGESDMALALSTPDEFRRDNMQVGHTDDLFGEGAFSVELWVRPNIPESEGYDFVGKEFGAANASGSYVGQSLTISSNPGTERTLQAGIATDPYTLLTITDVPMGEWSHIALTYDPALEEANTKLYINGVVKASGDNGGAVSQTVHPLRFGSIRDYDAGNSMIDDVMIWKSARSADDIASDMVSGVTGLESDLSAYWSFNGTTKDTSYNGHDGILFFKESFVESDCPHFAPESGTGGDTGSEGGAGGSAGSDTGSEGGAAGSAGSDTGSTAGGVAGKGHGGDAGTDTNKGGDSGSSGESEDDDDSPSGSAGDDSTPRDDDDSDAGSGGESSNDEIMMVKDTGDNDGGGCRMATGGHRDSGAALLSLLGIGLMGLRSRRVGGRNRTA